MTHFLNREVPPRRWHLHTGFTLVELLVSVALSLLVITMITSVAISGLHIIRSAQRTERLHSNALYITSTIGNYMRQSATWSVPNPQTLMIILPDNSPENIIYSSNRIMINDKPITTDDIQATWTMFIAAASSTQMGFTLKAVGGPETFAATTTFAGRN